MCDFCKNSSELLDIKIVQQDKTTRICPNCAAYKIANNLLVIKPGIFVSEITANYGAVMVELKDSPKKTVKYFLSPDETVNLLNHGLTPDQFDALAKKHDTNEYLLHDDFYVGSVALQPVNATLYTNQCKK